MITKLIIPCINCLCLPMCKNKQTNYRDIITILKNECAIFSEFINNKYIKDKKYMEQYDLTIKDIFILRQLFNKHIFNGKRRIYKINEE